MTARASRHVGRPPIPTGVMQLWLVRYGTEIGLVRAVDAEDAIADASEHARIDPDLLDVELLLDSGNREVLLWADEGEN